MSDRDDWRAEIASMNEQERYINLNAHRWAQGLTGEAEDDDQ